MSTDNDIDDLSIPAADVLRLIQAHLTQSGLHDSAAVLRAESGVGSAAPSHRSWRTWATTGRWDLILESLSTLDLNRTAGVDDDDRRQHDLLARVHEMAILEVAAAGDLQTAYAMLRLASSTVLESSSSRVYDRRTDRLMTRGRRVEMLLQDLLQQQQQSTTTTTTTGGGLSTSLPDDYYGEGGVTREERRRRLGDELATTLPVQPPDRLVTLLQQAVRYQSYTGVLPRVRRIWHADEDDEDDEDDNKTPTQDQPESSKQKKKKKKTKKRKVFDLVLGTVERTASGANSNTAGKQGKKVEAMGFNKALATVKFGKHAVCEVACYTPDGNSLITGSSDGLMEVWDTANNAYTLRADLPYQQQQSTQDEDDNANGLGHADAVTALTVSADGTLLASGTVTGEVTVWRLDSGRALRRLSLGSAVGYLCLTPDAGRVLAAGGSHCVEFGLRTAQRLREYGHGEGSLTGCGYHVTTADDRLRVWTAAADGCLRWYDAATAAFLAAWRCPHDDVSVGTSVVVDGGTTADPMIATSPALTTVLYVATLSCFVLVPRSSRAYLVNAEGTLVRVFSGTGKDDDSVICAATLSPGRQWLYAVREDGSCAVFDVTTGELEKSVSDVAKETVAKVREGGSVELSTLVPHPHKTHVTCFSSDKRQKKGQLVVWK